MQNSEKKSFQFTQIYFLQPVQTLIRELLHNKPNVTIMQLLLQLI